MGVCNSLCIRKVMERYVSSYQFLSPVSRVILTGNAILGNLA